MGLGCVEKRCLRGAGWVPYSPWRMGVVGNRGAVAVAVVAASAVDGVVVSFDWAADVLDFLAPLNRRLMSSAATVARRVQPSMLGLGSASEGAWRGVLLPPPTQEAADEAGASLPTGSELSLEFDAPW